MPVNLNVVSNLNFSFGDYISFIDWSITDAETDYVTSDTIAVSGYFGGNFGNFIVAEYYGSGFSVGSINGEAYVTTGTITSAIFNSNGFNIFEATGLNVDMSTFSLINEADQSGAAPLGIENYLMSLAWDVNLGESNDIANASSIVGDGAPFNLMANDVLRGNGGNDDLFSGNGNDKLFGGTGSDILDGGSGNDKLYGGTGLDDIYGGSGADIAYGGDDNDRMYGGNDNDAFYGENGDDLLRGNDGDDRLVGGDGNDRIYGGDGDDILKGQGGDDKLYGEAGSDIIFADADADELYGGADNDFLYGGRSDDFMSGGNGDDRLRGNLNNDTLNGNNGNDLLFGGGQNDTLNGEAGDDNLDGENGKDILNGGSGDDVLRGGVLADTFVFQSGNEIDRVRDWEDGVDKIDLSSYGFADAAAALSNFYQVGANVRFYDVPFSPDILIIENEILANITSNDLII